MLLDAAEELERALDRVGPAAVEHQARSGPSSRARARDERLVVREVAAERPPAELERAVPGLDGSSSAIRRTSSGVAGMTSLA